VTHQAWLDDDAEGVKGLEHAPKTTDKNESMFAHFDHVLRISQGACVHACLGVAHAQMMKAFETWEGLQARARAKRKKGETAEDDAAKVEEWKATSFFDLPPERRWEIITAVQRQYHSLCVLQPREELREMDQASLARKVAARDAEIKRHQGRFDKYKKFEKITPITLAEELEEQQGGLDGAALAEMLRDQIRVRVHVYQVKVAARIGDKHDEEELVRLRHEIGDLIVVPLPPKPGPPSPYPVRGAHAAPTAEAMELEKKHLVDVCEAYGEVLSMCNAGVFRAPRATRPKKAGPRQDAPERDLALVGTAFTEDKVDWKVVHVGWSGADKAVVVWYYDAALADQTGVPETDMKAFARDVADSRAKGACPAPLEFSAVREVRAWIRESRGE